MELVLELLGTTNNVLERQRFNQSVIRIGRGFGNDLIVADEHADVDHAELYADADGQLWLRDLDSVNGTRRAKSRQRVNTEMVDSGDVFLIGRNKLRVYRHDHAMPPAVAIRSVESLLLVLGRPAVIAALLVCYLSMTLYTAWQATLDEFSWSAFFGENLVSALMFVGFAAGVYLLSVLFRRSGNFPSHLSVLLTVGVLSTGVDFLVQIVRFNSGDNGYAAIAFLESALGYILLFLYLWSVLYLAFNFSVKQRTSVSATVVGLLFVVVLLFDSAQEQQIPRLSFPLQAVFLPPALQLVPPLDDQEFSLEARLLFDKLDSVREERLTERAAEG
ncbi:MAG: FHA domain-containing protein [Pseudomonadota bacterium]